MTARVRLHHIRRFAGVCAAVLVSGAQAYAAPVQQAMPSRPNILIIMTDDQRAWGTLSVMDDTRRWFGQGGTQYTQAYATTPLCCPSRSTIMTGRYVHNTGVRNNQSHAALDARSTMQRYLQQAGYRTALYGKYLNQWPLRNRPPFFNRFSIFGGGYYDTQWNDGGTIRNVSRNSTLFIEAKARAFIDEQESNDAQPWFMLLTTSAPHNVAEAEPQYADYPVGTWAGNAAVFETDRTDKPPLVQSNWHRDLGDGRKVRNQQLRSLVTVDDLVRDVALELRNAGEEQNTLAFFMSDNGVLWSEHGIYGKTWPYPPSSQIPLFMRWTGHVPAGVNDPRLAATIDIAPTIYEALGITPDPEYAVDGRSLLTGALRDKLLLEFWRTDDSQTTPWAGYIAETYQYTEYLTEDLNGTFFREYYDLDADPWELTNLLADGNPGNDPDVTTLAASLLVDRSCVGSSCP